MNAESFIKQKEITWDKPFSNWNRTAFKKALNEFAEMQKQAINYSHCCKSDSEQLLFSADEIVSKINEQTVLDGETFRVYFREK